jgi:hypothetical protein
MIEDLSRFRKFKSYYGLRRAFEKLARLVREFEFTDLDHADRMVDWDTVKTISF